MLKQPFGFQGSNMPEEVKTVEVSLTNTGRAQHVVYNADGEPIVILPNTTETVTLPQPLVDRLTAYNGELQVGGGPVGGPAMVAHTGQVLPSGAGADLVTKPAGGGGGVSESPQGEDPEVRAAVAEAHRKAQEEAAKAERAAAEKAQKAAADAAAKAQKDAEKRAAEQAKHKK